MIFLIVGHQYLALLTERRVPVLPAVKAVYTQPTLMEPRMRPKGVTAVASSRPESARSGHVTSQPSQAVFGPSVFRVPALEGMLQELKTTGNAPAAISGTKRKSLEDTLCDVVCSNSDLTSVISMISATTRINVVAIAASQDKLTLSLRRVRLAEALSLITASVGMTYLKVGSAFVIGTRERLEATYPKEWTALHPKKLVEDPNVDSRTETPTPDRTIPATTPDPMKTATCPVSYSDSKQMVESLKMLFGDKGLVAVVGPASTSPTLTEKDASGATGVSTGVIQNDSAPNGKLVILRGPTSVVDAAIEAIKSLDQQSAQVNIEVTIFDVTDSALNELGVSWTPGGTNFNETDPKGVNFGSFTRTPFNIGATLSALETADKAKILATPSVRVLDNERAFVLIGNKITLPKFDGYDANRIPIYSTSEFRVGIYLQVAPSIAADGTITMAIYPQVSTVVKFTEINGGRYPDIATREAQTTLRVKSGESIVLGGLLKNEDLEQLEQVPILSKIPLFGELFKRRKKTKSSSQVIISLTPTLIKPDRS